MQRNRGLSVVPSALPSAFVSVGAALLLLGGWVVAVGLLPRSGEAEPSAPSARAPEKVDFHRDIRPILSDKCFRCHGPDAGTRRADLRLDTPEGAFEDLGGYAAVVPGDFRKSELYRRITHQDPRDRMPPAKSGKSLTAEEIELLRRWIEEGAEWKAHWSYEPVDRPPVPEIEDADFVRNPIDRFILAHLRERGLEPSPPAGRVTLLRRLAFDLTGLPPASEEADAFAGDESPDAYEKLVERLLASPHYGERMALYWLDLVRYADTTGYHGDNHRDIWAYRDYVIDAFNDNKPFDVFTREQLAGDLLSGSTTEQKVASGYNRLNMTTQEGGAQAKEYVAKYAADRVRNASAVWMGATLGCAECHDHKYDPYTTRDFYSFGAFFADVREAAIGEPREGLLPIPSEEQSRRIGELDARIAELKEELEQPGEAFLEARRKWEASALEGLGATPRLGEWRSVGPFQAQSFDAAHDTEFGPEKDPSPDRAFSDGALRWTAHPEWTDGAVHRLSGQSSATYLARTIEVAEAREVGLSLGSDDGIRVWLDGERILDRKVLRGAAPDQEKVSLRLRAGENRILIKVTNGGGDHAFYFKLEETGLPADVRAALETPATERSPEQEEAIDRHYREISPELAAVRARIESLEKEKAEIQKQLATTMVTVSVEPMTMRVLPRGNWLDDSGDVVLPAVPHFLEPIRKEGRATRLDLAEWIVSRKNPLTARVFANRLWKLFFGRGLAKNLDDLGAQGAPPTHPELLDWLAAELVESGWDTKHMVRLLVLSGAYRQSSRASRELLERDPYNDHLARQGRWRLDAELVRDTALQLSGILSPRIGGPSARPYQPPGYWSHLNFPKRTYEADRGEGLYRRGLYTYWQRTFLYPSFLAFDAPTREDCCAERARSNTPLQSLVLLNDPVYVEAARALAARILQDGGASPAEKIRWAFRQALTREASAREVELLEELHAGHLETYEADREAAVKLLGIGESPLPGGMDLPRLAAWTSVARVILNLQETFTRN